ncbi:MAG: hypothetical protein NTV86_00820 [Planctomycetota bacterium]|nr:hypothetical protein [Planctomycetota bacterium]
MDIAGRPRVASPEEFFPATTSLQEQSHGQQEKRYHSAYHHVILSVSGGVPDLVFKPVGIAVTIFDYDAEGEDGADKDSDGGTL